MTIEELCSVMKEHSVAFSGDKALAWFRQKTKRIGERRWKRFLELVKQVQFFGGITLIGAEGEPDPICEVKTFEWHSDDPDVVGLYRPADGWIELIVSRMPTWARLEAVLRHEFVHMLQDITFKGCRDDVQAWSKADNLIRPFGKRASEFDEAVEGEAYWLMNRPGEVRREARKIQNDPDRWSNWHCSLANFIRQ